MSDFGNHSRDRGWQTGRVTLMLMFLLATDSCSPREPAPMDYCKRMAAKLDKTIQPQALRNAASTVVHRYPSGRAQRLATGEQPEAVRRVVVALDLAEASVCDDPYSGARVLCIDTPGGFAAYGLRVIPSPVTSIQSTNPNVRGYTELKWKDGIYIFYFVP